MNRGFCLSLDKRPVFVMASRFTLIIALFTLVLQHAKGQTCPSFDADKYVRNELLELRAELLTHMITAQQHTVETSQRELAHIEEEERQIQQAEQQRNQQLAQIEGQLASPYLEAERRPEVEAIKQNLSLDAEEKLRTEQSNVNQRKAVVVARVAEEQTQVHRLEERAAQVQRALAR